MLVECGEGVANGVIYVWKCGKCRIRVIPSGRDRGIVFTSSSTAYAEVFLFETAVNLSRNGCSLREAYRELSEKHVFPDATTALGSVTTLRKAVILYLSLVIAGLPSAVTRCQRCVRPDGSYAIICFDGLQLGYRLKFMQPFLRSAVSVSPIARASVYANMIKDAALAKALGDVMSAADTSTGNTITTITAMRGSVMAFVVLTGYVVVDGVKNTFAGGTLHNMSSRKERRWDPVEDGGIKLELIEFIRLFFMCRRAARAVAMGIIGAPVDLRRRVPSALMGAVNATAADLSDDTADVAGGADFDDLAEDAEDDGGTDGDGAEAERRAAEEERDGWASDGDGSDSGSAVTEVGEEVRPMRPYQPPAAEWDEDAPLLSYALRFSEPALADTGGVSAAARVRKLVLPLRSGIPGTAASALKVMDFLRALVVDPFTVWAPGDKWTAIEAVFFCLLDDDFTKDRLTGIVDRADVKELRLLRGAVACLGPALR